MGRRAGMYWGYPGYRRSHADPGTSPLRPSRLDAPRLIARIRGAVRAVVAARQDGRPGRAGQRRAPRAVRRAVAAHPVADRRLDRASRAPAAALGAHVVALNFNGMFDGICELVLEARDLRVLERFYRRLGMSLLAREDDRIWLAAG